MPIDIRRPLKKFMSRLSEAKDKSPSEADTVTLLIKFFEEVLGYDPIADITRELQVLKGKYVDIALKVDGTIKVLVEAKQAGDTLRDKHIEQVQSYATYTSFRWAVLTNGTAWKLYHMTGETIEDPAETVFDLDLSKAEEFDSAAEKLAILHQVSIRKGGLEEYRNHWAALSPTAIARAIFTEKVIGDIRAEIHREVGPLIDSEDLAKAIHDMLSEEVREQIGQWKIRRRRQATKRVATAGQVAAGENPEGVSTAKPNKGTLSSAAMEEDEAKGGENPDSSAAGGRKG